MVVGLEDLDDASYNCCADGEGADGHWRICGTEVFSSHEGLV